MATGLSHGISDIVDTDQDQLCVMVKFNSRQSYMLDMSSRQTIRELKDMVAQRAKLTANDICLVLGGNLLSDQSTLQASGLGTYTTVHAFCWSDDSMAAGDVNTEITTTGNENTFVDTQEQHIHNTVFEGESSVDSESRTTQTTDGVKSEPNENSRFFVHCKLCDCVRPGRLRVKCQQCNSGAFLVNGGPNNWEDISHSTALRGLCKYCGAQEPIFYLRCIKSHLGELSGTVALLKHVRWNRRRVECIICADVVSHIIVFPCITGHVMCTECFRQYSITCLKERRFVEHPQHGYTLPCPAGCPDSYIEESHHFLLMGQEKYECYKNFGAEEFVLKNGGLLCPAPGCGAGLFPNTGDRKVMCCECQFASCQECQREYHIGSCEDHLTSQALHIADLTVDDERAAQACWEQQSLSLIEEMTKRCPGCKIKTERSGGCMHMVCSRCGEEWCWICVQSWNRDCQADHWFG